jgi:hypothetical protein
VSVSVAVPFLVGTPSSRTDVWDIPVGCAAATIWTSSVDIDGDTGLGIRMYAGQFRLILNALSPWGYAFACLDIRYSGLSR